MSNMDGQSDRGSDQFTSQFILLRTGDITFTPGRHQMRNPTGRESQNAGKLRERSPVREVSARVRRNLAESNCF